jgi:hypothetical protein
MDLAALKAELIAGHPDTGAYNVGDRTAAAELNVENRSRAKNTLTGSEVLNAIDPPEFRALIETEQQTVWNILHLGTLNPWGTEATLFVSIFGDPSTTITALKAIRLDWISRAEELGFGTVNAGHVERARAS